MASGTPQTRHEQTKQWEGERVWGGERGGRGVWHGWKWREYERGKLAKNTIQLFPDGCGAELCMWVVFYSCIRIPM